MKRRWRAGAAALVLCFASSLAYAQDGAQPEAPPAEPEVSPAQAEYDALNKEMRDAQMEWREEYSKRRSAAEGGKFDVPERVEPGFQKRFVEGAAKYAGDDGAVPFLVMVASLGRSADGEQAKQAIDTIVASHVASPELTGLTFTLLYGTRSFGEDKVNAVATAIADGTPHADVKSAMLFLRGAVVQRRGAKSEDEASAAVADFEAAMAAAPESRYAKMSKGAIFELQNLQIGMTAPDIEGNDLDGVAFKLSDYRGQVVVLDFWGDW